MSQVVDVVVDEEVVVVVVEVEVNPEKIKKEVLIDKHVDVMLFYTTYGHISQILKIFLCEKSLNLRNDIIQILLTQSACCMYVQKMYVVFSILHQYSYIFKSSSKCKNINFYNDQQYM